MVADARGVATGNSAVPRVKVTDLHQVRGKQLTRFERFECEPLVGHTWGASFRRPSHHKSFFVSASFKQVKVSCFEPSALASRALAYGSRSCIPDARVLKLHRFW